MRRKHLPERRGMLFHMDGGPAQFHMRNTHIPLDVLYLDSDGVIIKRDEMEPHTGKSQCDGDVRYVLELPLGTCDHFGIQVGDSMTLGSARSINESYEDVVPVGVRVRVNTNSVPLFDILTDVRGLPNVITVSQDSSLQPAPEGKSMVSLVVKFNDDERFDLPDLESGLLKIKGIDMVRVTSYDGQPYQRQSKQVATESLLRDLVAESLKETWENPQRISDIVYRPWSLKFYEQVRQIKARVNEGSRTDWFEREVLSTDIGEFALFEGHSVPLDIPIPTELDEAEYRGEDVELDKPRRGGSAKFHVYVRDPKTGNVKKVNFGAKGMSVGIHDPDRIKSFVSRHKCQQRNDKTTASYWSCRLPRYWKSLGLKKTSRKWW